MISSPIRFCSSAQPHVTRRRFRLHVCYKRPLIGVALALCFAVSSLQHTYAEDAFELLDGDRVVMIGDGLIEQEQYFGWVELMMTTQSPDRNVTFRNLGWSADTPAGESRFGLSLLQAGREPADEGWRQLQKQIDLTRPTVALLGYGMASALQSQATTDSYGRVKSMTDFADHYQRLVRYIKQVSPDCRVICLSPISPVGETVLTTEMTTAYAGLIEQVSQTIGGRFIDLTETALDPTERKDPIHVNSDGYRAVADTLARSLGMGDPKWKSSPESPSLRAVILEKNRLWFHRSRPANMAYVFGFRKHEQGQNAVEIPQFDPLIEKEEQRIAALRGLDAGGSESPEPQIKSQYAEFTAQPTPDFVVADDLEVTLWAENPLLNKPIHMNFDAKGRLWIASSEAYPMIEVGQSMPDKILILEDTNGDGTADASTVFADGLLIPTGVAPGDGGVYVAQSTDLLFLKDTDGDGKADQRRRVLSGFGTEDTHHNLHTLIFGPDGRLYMNQSVYTRTDTETPYGVVRLKAGGGFRFDTRSQHMGVFFHGLWNPWGHQFDALGNSFMTDGAGFAGIASVFPGATFNPTPGSRRQLNLISPGSYPKFCGGEIIQGDSFPDDWQGSMVTCDFRANRVTRFSIDETDSGFVTTQQPDLIRTSASTFRPIDIKQGPDGALYVADWSNPIINHGEVDFRDPRRDRWHGRIWRITAKNRPLRQRVDLNEQDIASLISTLHTDDRYLKAQARRQLIERGDETAQQTRVLWERAGSATQRLDALRVAAAVGVTHREWLETLLQDPDGTVRAAATRILGDWSIVSDPSSSVTVEDATRWCEKLIADEHPRTRLETIVALGRFGDLNSVKLSLQALNFPRDRFIDHALFLNVDHHADELIADLSAPAWSRPESQKQLEFVLTSVEPAKATQFLGAYLARNQIPADGEGPWIELVGKAGGMSELASLYQQIVAGKFNDPTTVRALQALVDARRLRKAMPKLGGQAAKDLKALFKQNDQAIREGAIELAGAWQVRPLVPTLASLANNADLPEGTRVKAVDALRGCGGQATGALLKLADQNGSDSLRAAIVTALASTAPDKAVQPFYGALELTDNEQAALALWRSMLSAKNGVNLLTSSIPQDGVSQLAARAGIRAAGEGGRNAQALIDALMPMSGLSMTASNWSPERLAELRRLVSLKGDAARGESVYRRSSLQCVTCHAIGGIGGKVGPDMTSLGASAPVDYIIESLFDPDAKIKENYHSVTVLTEEGQVFAGIESGSTDEEMVLRDASNKLIRIPEAEIAQVKPGKSLMPAALLDRASQQDQLDLIRFLTQLGKPGDYDASRQTVARVLEVFAGTHRVEQQGNEGILSGATTQGWKPLLARVSGKIQRETLEELTAPPRNISLVNLYLRTQIEAGSDTVAEFKVDHLKRANLWIDGQPAGTLSEPIELSQGQHTLLIQIDARDLPDSITVRSEQVSFIAPEAN